MKRTKSSDSSGFLGFSIKIYASYLLNFSLVAMIYMAIHPLLVCYRKLSMKILKTSAESDEWFKCVMASIYFKSSVPNSFCRVFG